MRKPKANKYSKFYIEDFVSDFENEIKGKIFETDKEAEQDYINRYGIEECNAPMSGFIFTNSLQRVCPKKLTKKQKIKLLLLLKETDCEVNLYMSYADVLSLRDNNTDLDTEK